MQSDNCQSQRKEETKTMNTISTQQQHQQTIPLTLTLPQHIIDYSQLTRECKNHLDEMLQFMEESMIEVRMELKDSLDDISQVQIFIMQICSLSQPIDEDKTARLTNLYAMTQMYKNKVVQSLKKAINFINKYNHRANQFINKYQKITHSTDLNQYLNTMRKSLYQTLLKGMPTPILLMVGPAINNKEA